MPLYQAESNEIIPQNKTVSILLIWERKNTKIFVRFKSF